MPTSQQPITNSLYPVKVTPQAAHDKYQHIKRYPTRSKPGRWFYFHVIWFVRSVHTNELINSSPALQNEASPIAVGSKRFSGSYFFNHTSDLGIIGDANSTDPIVGHGCHLSGTSCSMPDEKETKTVYWLLCNSANDTAPYIHLWVHLSTARWLVYLCTCGWAVDQDKANQRRQVSPNSHWC